MARTRYGNSLSKAFMGFNFSSEKSNKNTTGTKVKEEAEDADVINFNDDGEIVDSDEAEELRQIKEVNAKHKKIADYTDDVVKDTFDKERMDILPFNMYGVDIPLPKRIAKSNDFKHNDNGGIVMCNQCKKMINLNDINSIARHAQFHNSLADVSNKTRIYATKGDIVTVLKKAYKLFRTEKAMSDEQAEYIMYLMIRAIYSRYVLAVLDLYSAAASIQPFEKFAKDTIQVFPERFPRKYIPYLIRTYCNGESSFMADNWFFIGNKDEGDFYYEEEYY